MCVCVCLFDLRRGGCGFLQVCNLIPVTRNDSARNSVLKWKEEKKMEDESGMEMEMEMEMEEKGDGMMTQWRLPRCQFG